jgi:hypothetical protein
MNGLECGADVRRTPAGPFFFSFLDPALGPFLPAVSGSRDTQFHYKLLFKKIRSAVQRFLGAFSKHLGGFPVKHHRKSKYIVMYLLLLRPATPHPSKAHHYWSSSGPDNGDVPNGEKSRKSHKLKPYHR